MCAKLNCLVIPFFRPKSSLKRSVFGAENIVLVFSRVYNKSVVQKKKKKMADKKIDVFFAWQELSLVLIPWFGDTAGRMMR